MQENKREPQLFQIVHMTTTILIACSYKETMDNEEQRACHTDIAFSAVDVTSVPTN
jgi:hypothetical protein